MFDELHIVDAQGGGVAPGWGLFGESALWIVGQYFVHQIRLSGAEGVDEGEVDLV